jgi:hypothetical protein
MDGEALRANVIWLERHLDDWQHPTAEVGGISCAWIRIEHSDAAA